MRTAHDTLLYAKIDFDVNTYEHVMDTNAKDPYGLVQDFLRSQIGAGEDRTPPEQRDVYRIEIQLNLKDDTFLVSSNTGNKGLRDGILMEVLTKSKV